jgi:hypothetical protein
MQHWRTGMRLLRLPAEEAYLVTLAALLSLVIKVIDGPTALRLGQVADKLFIFRARRGL